VTWGFFYLLICLGGFTLALVTGLVRRILHPTELCDHVVVPSHEHWLSAHTPKTDSLISFTTIFGLATFLVHGFGSFNPVQEIGIGAGLGAFGAVILRLWLHRACGPSRRNSGVGIGEAKVVREIPPQGYGQVEMDVGGSSMRMAARSEAPQAIPAGSMVRVLDCRESVLVVKPAGG
jgi:membrane protein implicated in regulation of membrane protease activity